MTGRIWLSCKHFWDARMSLLCFQVVHFRDISWTSNWNSATWCLFCLAGFLSAVLFCILKETVKTLLDNTEWDDFCTPGKKIWRVEIFCILIVQRLQLLQAFGENSFWRKGSSVSAATKSIVCSWQLVNQQMTVGYRRCVSIPVN